jgi:hypothetical protein
VVFYKERVVIVLSPECVTISFWNNTHSGNGAITIISF